MISARTLLYGVIGNPVRQSLSPIIHNGAFKRMGLNAAYLAFEVDDLHAAINGIRGLGVRGVSVTIPFKSEVISYLDQIDPIAEKIKAVNTIVNEKGKLIGYNTDWSGALEALEEKVDLKGRKALLLGAGGSARAIAYGLMERGCQVIISNRSLEKAVELAKEMGCLHWPLYPFQDMDETKKCGREMGVDVVINSTSVGMSPQDDQSPFPKEALREGMTVMDIVYQPLRTKLLREAEERGCQTIEGLEMLAYQGATQLQIWTGNRPDVRQIKEDLHNLVDRAGGTLFTGNRLGYKKKNDDRDKTASPL